MYSRRNLTFLTGFLVLGLAVVLGAMPVEDEPRPIDRDAGIRVVRAEPVELTTEGRVIRIPGVTRSTQRAALSFTVPARLAERSVEVGDPVRKGQIVARLDRGEFVLAERSASAAVAELDVRLEQAHRDDARVARLVDAKAATTEELEAVRSATATLEAVRDVAAAGLADARRVLGETFLTAPFDGTVTRVELEPGEWASPGATIVEVAGRDRIEVRVEVPESIREGIVVGAVVDVILPMSDIIVEGRVSSVAQAAAGPGALFPVIVQLTGDDRVKPGQTAQIAFTMADSARVTVPLSAVIDSGSSRPSVFRVSGGIAERIAIEPGKVVGERLIVLNPKLADGDLVAVLGHTALVDGDEVEVR